MRCYEFNENLAKKNKITAFRYCKYYKYRIENTVNTDIGNNGNKISTTFNPEAKRKLQL